MKKRKLLLLPLALAMYSANAQKVSPQVLNATGKTIINGSVTVEYSVGELAISMLTSNGNYVTQGALQPKKVKIVAGLEANAYNNSLIAFYPNPVVENLTVTCPKGYSAAVYDIEGVNLGKIETNAQVNASDMATGMYIIKVADQDNKIVNTFKFIKL